MQIRRVVAICLVALVAVVAWPVYAQRNNNTNKPPVQSQEQIDAQALYAVVDGVTGGALPVPADIPVTMVQHHFLMTAGGTVMVPFTVSIDKSKVNGPAVFYIRVVDKDAPMGIAAPPPPAPANNERNNRNNRNQAPPPPMPAGPTFPYSGGFFGEVPADGQLSRAVELKPGRYELFFTLKERGIVDPKAAAAKVPPAPAPIKAGLLRLDLTVPDLSAGLGTSSIILADSVEPAATPLTAQQQQASPYTIGGVLKIAPNLLGRFGKAGELATVFWVYGITSVSGKPDVQVDYTFHRRLPEGEKYFNKTEPQQYNAQTSAPTFNLDAGHQLMAIQGLSVQSFPAGDYRLEIKITDKPSGKTVTQNVNFTVLPV
jgi:hypothetical protein